MRRHLRVTLTVVGGAIQRELIKLGALHAIRYAVAVGALTWVTSEALGGGLAGADDASLLYGAAAAAVLYIAGSIVEKRQPLEVVMRAEAQAATSDRLSRVCQAITPAARDDPAIGGCVSGAQQATESARHAVRVLVGVGEGLGGAAGTIAIGAALVHWAVVPLALVLATPRWLRAGHALADWQAARDRHQGNQRERADVHREQADHDAADPLEGAERALALRSRLEEVEREGQALARAAAARRARSARRTRLTESTLAFLVFGAGILIADPRQRVSELLLLAVTIGIAVAKLRGAADAVGQLDELVPRFDDLLALDALAVEEPAPPPRRPEVTRGPPSIHADAVTYAPPDDPSASVVGVTVTVAAGEILAIAGRDGQMTLARLLAGVWQPLAGTVSWDGRPLIPGGPAPAVAFLPRSPAGLALELGRHVALRPVVPVADGDAAERGRLLVGVADVIDALVQHMDGATEALPADAWPRLAEAYAGLLDPSVVLVVDDPTERLDVLARHGVLADLVRAVGGRTVVLIARTRETEQIAHRTVELAGGRIVAER